MAGNRCPSCQKMVGIDTDQEPDEQNAPTLNQGGGVAGYWRVAHTCADCGTEMREWNVELDADHEAELTAHLLAKHRMTKDAVAELDLDETFSLSIDDPQMNEHSVKAAGGRPARYFDFAVEYHITCNECAATVVEDSFSDSIQASEMDSLVE